MLILIRRSGPFNRQVEPGAQNLSRGACIDECPPLRHGCPEAVPLDAAAPDRVKLIYALTGLPAVRGEVQEKEIIE